MVPCGHIGSRLFASGQAIVDMAPMVRRRVGGIDAGGFHRVDCPHNLANVRPANDAQQDLGAGTNEGQGGIGLARMSSK
jgi:hypothetical protein